jgi:hypothetical protein
MSKTMTTSRRSFLKSGAIVAAPVVAVTAPAVACAADDSKAKLARLQDERAIEALGRDFVRNFNASGAKGTAKLFADGKAPGLAKASRLALDAAAEPELLEIAADGASARSRHAVTVESEHAIEGEGTLVQMARLQGNTATRTTEQRVLIAEYVKHDDRWAIGSLRLA